METLGINSNRFHKLGTPKMFWTDRWTKAGHSNGPTQSGANVPFFIIFKKKLIYQRRPKALMWSKGLNHKLGYLSEEQIFFNVQNSLL